MTKAYLFLCAACWATHPLEAQRAMPVGVTAPIAQHLMTLNDAQDHSEKRVALTMVGVVVGAYAGVATVEVYRATHNISSHKGKRGADYVGGTLGAATFGFGTWWLSGKWL